MHLTHSVCNSLYTQTAEGGIGLRSNEIQGTTHHLFFTKRRTALAQKLKINSAVASTVKVSLYSLPHLKLGGEVMARPAPGVPSFRELICVYVPGRHNRLSPQRVVQVGALCAWLRVTAQPHPPSHTHPTWCDGSPRPTCRRRSGPTTRGRGRGESGGGVGASGVGAGASGATGVRGGAVELTYAKRPTKR
jgi:hypothetical protein